MTQQQNVTAEALQRGAMPGPGYAIANRLSQIFHPVVLGIGGIIIVGGFALPQPLIGLAWALLCIAIQIIPPMIFFTIRLRQGAYSDEDVSVRHQRNELYLFSMVTVLVGIAVLLIFDAPAPFLALVCSGAIMNGLCWLINLFWKISVHAASAASCATVASIYVQFLGLLLWMCVLAVGWSRVRTRNHTIAQVIAGISLATVSVVGMFAVFGLV